MERYAVYPDVSPGYVLFDTLRYIVFDTLSETLVAVYHVRRNAERVARRLNNPPGCSRILGSTEEGGHS